MAAPAETVSPPGIRSLIPARIDRLPWSRFHTRLVIALGVAWILDGLEITIASNVGPDLTQKAALNMSAGAVFCAVDAEGKALEDVATPLSVIAKPAQTIFRSGDPRGPLPSAGD